MITAIVIFVGGLAAIVLVMLAFVTAVVAAEFRAARSSFVAISAPAGARARVSHRAAPLALDAPMRPAA